jgi:Domain of unknown function (DUF4375)
LCYDFAITSRAPNPGHRDQQSAPVSSALLGCRDVRTRPSARRERLASPGQFADNETEVRGTSDAASVFNALKWALRLACGKPNERQAHISNTSSPYDYDQPPSSISAERIARDTFIASTLQNYLRDKLADTKTYAQEDEVFARLPSGYRPLYLYLLFWSDVDNGGFPQFFCNAASFDSTGQVIPDTIDVLRRYGMHDLAELLEAAVAIGAKDLPPKAVARLSDEEMAKAREISDEDIWARLDALTEKFNALNYSWIPKLVEYARQHPEEFVDDPGS